MLKAIRRRGLQLALLPKDIDIQGDIGEDDVAVIGDHEVPGAPFLDKHEAGAGGALAVEEAGVGGNIEAPAEGLDGVGKRGDQGVGARWRRLRTLHGSRKSDGDRKGSFSISSHLSGGSGNLRISRY